MPNRIIKESICTSASVDGLSWFEEVFFYRLIVNCDDYGRFDARLAVLRARLFPLKDITNRQIEAALSKLVTAGMVRVYEYDRQPFLQLENWSKHQSVRNKRSKYPDPNTIEINCKQLHANVPVIQSLSESVSLSESESETRATPGATAPDRPHTEPDEPPTKKPPSAQERRFDEFWNFYPRKIGKGAAAKAYQKIKPDDALHKTILAAIVLAKNSRQWTENGGQYIPNPATWLNQGRWEDELDTAERSDTSGANQANHRQDQAGNAGRCKSAAGSAGDRYKPDPAEVERIARERGIL